MLHIKLPLPPSVNALYKNAGKRGRVATPEYDAWRMHAGLIAKKHHKDAIEGEYVLYLAVPKKMRGDCSNRIKAVEDLLVNLGLTSDDRFNQGVAAWRHESVEPGFCEVIADTMEPQ